MQFLLFLLSGIVGGVFGGMGMGGGTLLIPILTIFFNLKQHLAQAVNLISFIPMAIVALIIHLKNKLVDFSNVVWIIAFGVASCILGCYVSKIISGDLLSRLFGGFLILLAVFQFVVNIKNKSK